MKYLSHTFPIQNGLKSGEDFSPFLFTFALEETIMKVEQNPDESKLNVTHQLQSMPMVLYWVKILVLQRQIRASVVASKEADLEVNAEKSNYVCISVNRM